MSVSDNSEAVEIAAKSSALAWSCGGQHVQFWCQWHAQALQFHQQIRELGCLVEGLEASDQSTHQQMKELRVENATLRSQLSLAGSLPALTPSFVAYQAEHVTEAPTCREGDDFPPFFGPPPGLFQADPHPDVKWEEKEFFKTETPPFLTADAISTRASSMGGRPSTVVQWRIPCFSTQLAGGMGRSLVSPPFDVSGFCGLRLMVAPKLQGVLAPRGQRARHAHKKLVTEGPLDGCLMLKVPDAPDVVLEYSALIGGQRRGPFTNNFCEQCVATHSHFGIDWLQERGDDGSLLVGVEVVARAD